MAGLAATANDSATFGKLGFPPMTLEELEREYVALRQQAEAVRSYL
jgi:hypothetical protein